MTTYQMRLNGDTLEVDFAKTPEGNPILADGDKIVREVEMRLQEMMTTGELKGGELLKINGRISVPASYTVSHQVAHLYRAVAVADPRLGAYIVVASTTNNYPIGSRIDSQTGEVKEVAGISDAKPSFLIYWKNDILIAKINNGIKVDGDQILRDAEAQLQYLINSGQLPGGKQLLIIHGRTTLLASFLIASKVAHQYGAIAMFDPKMGDKGIDRYIVTISHSPNYQVGQTFDINYHPYPTVKAVLCGPPNAGKTVLRDSLKQAIFQLDQSPTDFYVISGCPDGDGAWYSETAQKYPEVAAQLKQEYKSKFTPEFAQAKARDIKVIKNSLLLFDVGGKVTPENEIIMSQATHAIILAKTEADVHDWQEFCQELNLPVVAVIYSDLNGIEEKLINEDPLLTGNVCQLKRGADVSSRPMVQALANLLVKLTKS